MELLYLVFKKIFRKKEEEEEDVKSEKFKDRIFSFFPLSPLGEPVRVATSSNTNPIHCKKIQFNCDRVDLCIMYNVVSILLCDIP